jgi:hypothetical protein
VYIRKIPRWARARGRILLAAATAAYLSAALPGVEAGQLSNSFSQLIDHPAIAYKTTESEDPVAILKRRIESGAVQLSADGPSEYLRPVLAALNISIDSQIAVFAQDSVQRAIIERENPRTLFFNDSVVVGWVRKGFIELAGQDPVRGTVFYTLTAASDGTPQLARRDDCLSCHYSFPTSGVPGMLVRSAGEFAVNHSLPLERRWGGWYVTGTSGSLRHRGNLDIDRIYQPPLPKDGMNWPSFAEKFDTSGYLSTHSDIVALMVFEHQMHLMNLLGRMSWESRLAAYQNQQASLRGSARSSADSDEPLMSLDEAAQEIVDYMLFVNEAPIASAIKGSSGFTERFERLGPFDSKGRSLRQFDLGHRLMRYPCSYLVYSEAFENLPAPAKTAIYQRMWKVLSGADAAAKYRRLSLADRRAIAEILRDTKRDLPPEFDGLVR